MEIERGTPKVIQLENKIISQLVLALPRREGKYRVENRICHRRSLISETRRKMKANHLFIKNDTSSWEKITRYMIRKCFY